MEINFNGKNLLSRPLMFAEEGQANQGDFKFALKMIDLVHESGADGIEFQLGIAKDLYLTTDPGYEIYKKREFETSQIRELVEYTHSKKMAFQAAPLSTNIVKTLIDCGVDVFTINAMDLNNPFMLDMVAESKKPFWLATLMGKTNEIDWAVNHITKKTSSSFGLLHGQHIMAQDNSIGVPSNYAQLDCIDLFKRKYNIPVGYIDHTPTVIMPALALSKGADIVFKHLKPSREWKGPDFGVCLSPKDWKLSKSFFDYASESRGSSKNLSQDEVEDRSHQRRSLYFSKNLTAGKKLNLNDVNALRPGGGFDPKNISNILDKKLSRDVQVGMPVDIKLFEGN
ncbi:MAG: hypothetical protein CL881_07865 [Dehalococcoidia bacterium]|nr:hypothetical protein [Dehalococcoidia bacterium]